MPDPTGPTPEASPLTMTFDEDTHAGYLYAQRDRKVARTVELGLEVHIDLADDGSVIGVEWIGQATDVAIYVALISAWPLAVAEGRREAAEEWSKALGVAADVLLSMEAKRTALAEREARMEGTTDA